MEWKEGKMNPKSDADVSHRNLQKLGGAAAWIAALLVLSEVVVFVIHPQPGPIDEWFRLLQSDPLMGWLELWGLEIPLYAMFFLVFLALYSALRKTDPGLMKIALAAGMLGIGIFFATNNPFSMLALSRQHAAAATDAERSMFLAAGQALLADTGQRAVGGFNMGVFLVSVAGLIASGVMVRSGAFGKPAGYAGLLANALSLADYARAAVTSSEIAVLIVVLPNVLFLTAWLILVGRRLLRLGGGKPESPDPLRAG
jgi:hypothetical protein